MIRLEQTCGACPEQDDAYLGDSTARIGCLRLRHGHFYAACPDVEGEIVYQSFTQGDGVFEVEEREQHLSAAKTAIAKWLADHLNKNA